MKSASFLVFCLVLVVGYFEVYRHFQNYFSGTDGLKTQVKTLKEKLNQEELKTSLVEYQLRDLKEDVATYLPEVKQKMAARDEGFTARNIASIVAVPREGLNLERASSLFEKGKKYFRDKNFKRSNKIFNKLVSQYPESIHALEAYFFLVEGLFQLREYEDCVLNVETMIQHYPENELTGFALLRLGKVYESQERNEDAAEVYRTVEHSYDNPELKHQADIFLKAIQL